MPLKNKKQTKPNLKRSFSIGLINKNHFRKKTILKKKLKFHSLFISVLVNTVLVSDFLNTPRILKKFNLFVYYLFVLVTKASVLIYFEHSL